MSDIDITYKGASIATMNASGTKTLLTSGKYCEDDIEIDYTKPDVTVDSLTITSGGTYTAPTGHAYSPVTVASGSVTAPSTISGSSATVSTGTNTLTLSKTVSVTPNVTTNGYITSGTAGNSDISLTASVNTRSSSDLTASGATVTAPSGYYASNATKTVASGTEGTPTATKGTVSSHSITVTPSVTNTSGYISGGTHNGTAVTVSASELVSGSETKTANGTYDVTNLAQIIVNVSGGGGGGLVYETGTWSPSEDVARPTINFTNTHSSMPVYVCLTDSGNYYDTLNSNMNFVYCDYSSIANSPIYVSTTNLRYALVFYIYRGTSATGVSQSYNHITNPVDDQSEGSNGYAKYWVKPDSFRPYTNSDSRYWRSGRTYKWIAVWAPTT